ncbi:MAG: TonB-dependent receptor [Prevotellaceae bacterium]|jgi:outer membrane receptor protein involved in Fe transport|nr:TonB-dependent receptor [Prevotellaceae bacterium]
MNKIYTFIFILFLPFVLQAQKQDSTVVLDEIIVSSKEGQELKKIPASVSIISAERIDKDRIESVRNLSSSIPNLFIPDYGSKYTSAVYIRGVGSRLGNSAIGMYVDNVPYIDKTSFDFDFFDISRIEVLRGPQGTLYGRNSMGGLINIYTLSPWDFQGTKLKLSSGSYGLVQAKLSHYAKLSEKFAFSVGGNYSATGGFFRNTNPDYSGKTCNPASKIFPSFYGKNDITAQSAALRLTLGWIPTEKLSINYVGSMEYSDQNGYAYGKYNLEKGLSDTVNYNDRNSYERRIVNNSLRIEYKTDKYKIASTTGSQFLQDSMFLDQDFSAASMFTLFQGQKLNSVNQEFTVRSNNGEDFLQWIAGVSGFYQNLKTDSKVTFKEDGIKMIEESIKTGGMPFPFDITDENIPVLGDYTTQNYGLAAFAQLTYNSLFIKGLSASAGLRLDYENVALKHFNLSKYSYSVTMPGRVQAGSKSDTIAGNEKKDFTQLLPKFALKYEKDGNMIYVSASKGYKAGGYNLQMFSDLMELKMRNTKPVDINVTNSIYFKPEYSWNYELGGKLSLLDKRINAGITLFLLKINDQQIAEFAPNGQGRMIKNAGESESKGVEADITFYPVNALRIALNWGYTDSRFTKYTERTKTDTVDYSGKHVPFIPTNTLSVAADYTFSFNSSIIDRLSAGVKYSGAGKIYWTEANDIFQKFYSTLDARISVEKGNFSLNVWGRNLTGTKYTTFYFKTFNKHFGQLGKPVHFGIDLNVKF